MEKLSCHWKDFREIWCVRIFRKHMEKIEVWLKIEKNNWYFIWRPIAEFSLEWGMFQTEAVEKIKHAFYVEQFFFSKILPFMIIWKKYATARQAANDKTKQRTEDAVCTLSN